MVINDVKYLKTKIIRENISEPQFENIYSQLKQYLNEKRAIIIEEGIRKEE
jgi:hypothetical protein